MAGNAPDTDFCSDKTPLPLIFKILGLGARYAPTPVLTLSGPWIYCGNEGTEEGRRRWLIGVGEPWWEIVSLSHRRPRAWSGPLVCSLRSPATHWARQPGVQSSCPLGYTERGKILPLYSPTHSACSLTINLSLTCFSFGNSGFCSFQMEVLSIHLFPTFLP